MEKNETVNMYSHLTGAILMSIITALLIYVAREKWAYIIVVTIYGMSTILLFSASALYHFNKKVENSKSAWRVFDHISIYLMIAGTYTPICFFSMSKPWWITIVSVQWGLALAGFCFELFRINAPRWLTTSIYLVMGWVAIVAVVPIYKGIELNAFLLLVTGAVLYSSGAIIYAIKRPNPFPGVLGFHEIFHVLVLLANGTFALMIYKILVTYKALPR